MNLGRYSPFLPFVVLALAAIAFNLLKVIGGNEWGMPSVAIVAVLALCATAALTVAAFVVAGSANREILAVVRWARRSDLQITLFEVMVMMTCVAVFLAARSYLARPPHGNADLFIVKQFALFWAVFITAGLALAWRQHRRQKAAEAIRLKAGETPIQLEAVDGNQ
jgi:hypothetical protein